MTIYSAPASHFPFQTPKFLVHIQRARIGADADQQRRLRSHRVAAEIQTLIQVIGDVREADRVDIEDRGGVRISAHARRIARDADEIANSGRMRAQKLALDAQRVAVAAAEVKHGFDPGVLLD